MNRRERKRTGGRGRHRTSAVALAAAAIIAVSVGATGATAAGEQATKAAPATQTIKKSMWGPPVGPDGKSIFPTLKDLGVGLYSIQARWDQIAPTTKPLLPTDPLDPAYQWPQYLVDAVADANAQGIQVQMLIMGTPPWANGGKSWQFVPDQTQDFARLRHGDLQEVPDRQALDDLGRAQPHAQLPARRPPPRAAPAS